MNVHHNVIMPESESIRRLSKGMNIFLSSSPKWIIIMDYGTKYNELWRYEKRSYSNVHTIAPQQSLIFSVLLSCHE